MIRQLVFVQHYSRSLHSVSGTVLGAGDDAGNKYRQPPRVAVCLQRHSFILKVFIKHLHSEPGVQQCLTKPVITGRDRSFVVVIAKKGRLVQVL